MTAPTSGSGAAVGRDLAGDESHRRRPCRALRSSAYCSASGGMRFQRLCPGCSPARDPCSRRAGARSPGSVRRSRPQARRSSSDRQGALTALQGDQARGRTPQAGTRRPGSRSSSPGFGRGCEHASVHVPPWANNPAAAPGQGAGSHRSNNHHGQVLGPSPFSLRGVVDHPAGDRERLHLRRQPHCELRHHRLQPFHLRGQLDQLLRRRRDAPTALNLAGPAGVGDDIPARCWW